MSVNSRVCHFPKDRLLPIDSQFCPCPNLLQQRISHEICKIGEILLQRLSLQDITHLYLLLKLLVKGPVLLISNGTKNFFEGGRGGGCFTPCFFSMQEMNYNFLVKRINKFLYVHYFLFKLNRNHGVTQRYKNR